MFTSKGRTLDIPLGTFRGRWIGPEDCDMTPLGSFHKTNQKNSDPDQKLSMHKLIVYTKFQPPTCLNSKEYNINMYDDMVEQRWLPKPKKSFSTSRV